MLAHVTLASVGVGFSVDDRLRLGAMLSGTDVGKQRPRGEVVLNILLRFVPLEVAPEVGLEGELLWAQRAFET